MMFKLKLYLLSVCVSLSAAWAVAPYVVADEKSGDVVVETTDDGVILYENPELLGKQTVHMDGNLVVAVADVTEAETYLYAVETGSGMVPVEMDVEQGLPVGSHFSGEVVVEGVRGDMASAYIDGGALPVARAEVSVPEVAQAKVAAKHRIYLGVATPKGEATNGITSAAIKDFVGKATDYWKAQTNGGITEFSIAQVMSGSLSQGCGMKEQDMWSEVGSKFSIPVDASYVNHIMVLLPSSCKGKTYLGGYAGIAQIGTSGGKTYLTVVDTGSTNFSVTAHELGHNLGLYHAGSLVGTSYDSSGYQEYADTYSVMGVSINATIPALDAIFRRQLETLAADEMESITPNATGVTRNVKAISLSSGLRSLRVTSPVDGHDYFIEYRSGTGSDVGTVYSQDGYSKDPFCTFSKGVRITTVRSDKNMANLSKHDAVKDCERTNFLAGDELIVGGAFSVKVNSIDTVGDIASVTIKSVMPEAPASVTLEKGTTKGSLVASWSAASSGGGTTISGYTITLTSGLGVERATTVSGSTLKYTFLEVIPGRYTFSVKAKNSLGAESTKKVSAALLVPLVEVNASNPNFVDTTSSMHVTGINWMYRYAITSGTSATQYSPKQAVTREQMATFLYRLAGSHDYAPTGGELAKFGDIAASQHKNAIAWLVKKGVTSGTSASTYSPKQSVTREQMATFLYRIAGSPAYTPTSAELGKFKDISGSQHKNAIAWLVKNGITSGTSATTYSPKQAVTREQMATFMSRLYGLLTK